MVTPEEIRRFAIECLRWSVQTSNPSHRDLMIQVAKNWLATAVAIERRVSTQDDIVLPDLRNKLD
jgi:hypothetical protein